MENNPDIFDLDFKGGKIRVQRHFVAKQTIYRIDKRLALVVTKALNENALRCIIVCCHFCNEYEK